MHIMGHRPKAAFQVLCVAAMPQVGLDEAAAMDRLTGAIPSMLQWMRTFLAPQPQPGSLVDVGYSGGGPPAQRMCIQVRITGI